MTQSTMTLTDSIMAAILNSLSPHVTVRGESRKKQQMPIQARLLHRLRYHMQEIIYGGRYLESESSQDSVVLSLNPNNVHRPDFERVRRCSLTFNRDNAMSQPNSAQNSEQTTQPAIFPVLPIDYPVHDKADFFVLIAKSTDLMPVVYPDQLMLMRINSYANAGDIVMLNDDVTLPVIGFCQDAGFYGAVCVAAKPQVLELLPDGTVSRRRHKAPGNKKPA